MKTTRNRPTKLSFVTYTYGIICTIWYMIFSQMLVSRNNSVHVLFSSFFYSSSTHPCEKFFHLENIYSFQSVLDLIVLSTFYKINPVKADFIAVIYTILKGKYSLEVAELTCNYRVEWLFVMDQFIMNFHL